MVGNSNTHGALMLPLMGGKNPTKLVELDPQPNNINKEPVEPLNNFSARNLGNHSMHDLNHVGGPFAVREERRVEEK